MVHFDEASAQLEKGMGRGEASRQGKGEGKGKRGNGKKKASWRCPCLVTALLRGKSLTSLGPRLT